MGSCADPCDRASTLNEPYMQVDVIDLAASFSWMGLEKLDLIILTSIGLLATNVNAIETFIRGQICILSSRIRKGKKKRKWGISRGQKDHTNPFLSQQGLICTYHSH